MFCVFFLPESHLQRGQLLQDQESVQRWYVPRGQVNQQAEMVSVLIKSTLLKKMNSFNLRRNLGAV